MLLRLFLVASLLAGCTAPAQHEVAPVRIAGSDHCRDWVPTSVPSGTPVLAPRGDPAGSWSLTAAGAAGGPVRVVGTWPGAVAFDAPAGDAAVPMSGVGAGLVSIGALSWTVVVHGNPDGSVLLSVEGPSSSSHAWAPDTRACPTGSAGGARSTPGTVEPTRAISSVSPR